MSTELRLVNLGRNSAVIEWSWSIPVKGRPKLVNLGQTRSRFGRQTPKPVDNGQHWTLVDVLVSVLCKRHGYWTKRC